MDALYRATLLFQAQDRASRVVEGVRRAVDAAGERVRAAARNWDAFAEKLDKVGQAASTIGRGMAVAGALIGATLIGATNAAVSWQSAMADVAKVTSLGGAELERMGSQLRGLTRLLPLTHSEIAEIAAAGGTMGVPTRQLVAYTETVGRFSVAWDMAARDVGNAAGKIAVAYGIAFDNLEPFGNAVNFLADKVGGEASELVDFVARLGGTARTLRIAENDVAAFAATMIGAGAIPERAATAFETMTSRLADVTGLSKPAMAAFNRLGMDAERFKRSMQTDATGTLIQFLERLKGSGDALSIANAVLGQDAGPAALLLMNNIGRLQGALSSLDAQAQRGSVDEEFARRMETAASSVALMKSSIVDAGITIGSHFLPYLAAGAQAAARIVNQISAWAQANPETSRTLLRLTVAISGLLVTVGGGLWVFGSLASGVSEGMKALRGLSDAMGGLRVVSRLTNLLGGLRDANTALSASIRGAFAPVAEFGRGLRSMAAATWASARANVFSVSALRAMPGRFVAATQAAWGFVVAQVAAARASVASALGATRAALVALPARFVGAAVAAWGYVRASTAATWASLTTVAGLRALAAGAVMRAVGAFRAVTSVVWAMNAAFLANPLVWIGALVVGVAFMIWRYWRPISAFFSSFWDGLIAGLAPVMPVFTAIGHALAPIVGWFRSIFSQANVSAETMQRFASAGQSAGRAVAAALVWVVARFRQVLDFGAAGARLIDNFAAGIRSRASAVLSAIRDVLGPLARFVPQSPVKEGPLRAFNQGGQKLMQLFASTVTPAPLTAALGRAFDQAERAVPRGVGLTQRALARPVPAGIRLPEPGRAVGRAAGGVGGAAPISVSVTVNVSGGATPAQAAEVFGAEFEREVRRVLQLVDDRERRLSFVS